GRARSATCEASTRANAASSARPGAATISWRELPHSAKSDRRSSRAGERARALREQSRGLFRPHGEEPCEARRLEPWRHVRSLPPSFETPASRVPQDEVRKQVRSSRVSTQ